MQFQKSIGRFPGYRSPQSHFLYQTVLQGFNSRSMRPLACGLCAAIHGDSQFVQSTSELRTCRIATQLLGPLHRTGGSKDAVAIRVVRHRTAIASQPASQSLRFSSVLSCSAKRAQMRLVASSIRGDQLAGRAAILQPAKRRTILHHQLSETRSSFPPQVHGF